MSVKIQIPLFGQYLKYGEMFDKIIFNLQKDEFFLKSDKLETNNGIIYQISSNDYELLEIFANWYKAVEKFEKITKSDFAQEMKNKLIQFVKDNDQIPSE
jgi:predicted nuclease of restriction endonuclease-like RecB superfamily